SFPKRRPCRDDGLGQAAMFAGGAWTEARPPRVSKIGPALSSSNTIRRRPSADPVQKHAPGNGYGAKKGLTSRGPLQKHAPGNGYGAKKGLTSRGPLQKQTFLFSQSFTQNREGHFWELCLEAESRDCV